MERRKGTICPFTGQICGDNCPNHEANRKSLRYVNETLRNNGMPWTEKERRLEWGIRNAPYFDILRPAVPISEQDDLQIRLACISNKTKTA